MRKGRRFPASNWLICLAKGQENESETSHNVVKTAAFTNGRRIAAGWVPSRREGKDNGNEMFGGNVVIREVFQNKDGSLSIKFASELLPESTAAVPLNIVADSLTKRISATSYRIISLAGKGAFKVTDLPLNARITMEVEMQTPLEEFGLLLRATNKTREGSGYALSMNPGFGTVMLHNTTIKEVNGLDKKLKLDIIMKDDIIDVNVGDSRCIVNRLAEQKGNNLIFFAKHGVVQFNNITVSAID